MHVFIIYFDLQALELNNYFINAALENQNLARYEDSVEYYFDLIFYVFSYLEVLCKNLEHFCKYSKRNDVQQCNIVILWFLCLLYFLYQMDTSHSFLFISLLTFIDIADFCKNWIQRQTTPILRPCMFFLFVLICSIS